MRAQQGLSRLIPEIAPEIEFRDRVLQRALLAKDLSLEPEPIFPPFKIAVKIGGDPELELTCFLITAKEKPSGFMAFAVPPDRDITAGKDFHLLGSVANFLGGAIQNANLLQTIDQHREELQRLTGKLYHTLDFERKRIAQDLHDETGQSLTGIKLTLEALEKDLSPGQSCIAGAIQEIKLQIEQVHQEIGRISHRLHPALLSELGLEPALEAYFSEIRKKADLIIDYSITGFEERLDSKTETTLYRISQEALNNAIKHSKAKHFRLSIVKSYPNIIFVAQDDGIGVNPDYLASKRLALGLVGMRERVHMLNGKFSMSSSMENGTRIRAEIPLQESPYG
jgi:signal transduction histidine kinase